MPTLLMCRPTTSGASIIAELMMCENCFLITLYILAFLVPLYSVMPGSQRVDNIAYTLLSCHVDANEYLNSLHFGSSFPRTLFRFFSRVRRVAWESFANLCSSPALSPFCMSQPENHRHYLRLILYYLAQTCSHSTRATIIQLRAAAVGIRGVAV